MAIHIAPLVFSLGLIGLYLDFDDIRRSLFYAPGEFCGAPTLSRLQGGESLTLVLQESGVCRPRYASSYELLYVGYHFLGPGLELLVNHGPPIESHGNASLAGAVECAIPLDVLSSLDNAVCHLRARNSGAAGLTPNLSPDFDLGLDPCVLALSLQWDLQGGVGIQEHYLDVRLESRAIHTLLDLKTLCRRD